MSFVLPGNPRQLRFTGEARALRDDSGTPGAGIALGKPRVRKPTTPPPAIPSARPARASVTPPSPGIVPFAAPRQEDGSYHPSIRAAAQRVDPNDRSWDGDDQQATMAFDREGADVLPGANLRATAPPPGRGQASVIPGFRPAHQIHASGSLPPSPAAMAVAPAQQALILPNQPFEVRSKGAPLSLWIFAAILAGILSYYVTPTLMSTFEAPPPAPTHSGS